MSDGALLLDKPVGLSSNRALQSARKLMGMCKAGHAGTLDPLASGLLVVLLGEATKFAGPLLDADKEYLATVRLGETTTTGDAEGEVLERKRILFRDTELAAVLESFRGEIDQIPPMHSALKRGGVPLYRLARRGEQVERVPRRVTIRSLELVERGSGQLVLRVRCSKGTYVRVLAEDIGRVLGCGAHLAALRRTASGSFGVQDAASLESLAEMNIEQREARLIPLARLLEPLPRAELDERQAARFRQGQALDSFPGEGLRAVYGADGRVIGLGQAGPGGVLKPLRLVAQGAEKH
jgi:tRNA pseudouridine55 synthase